MRQCCSYLGICTMCFHLHLYITFTLEHEDCGIPVLRAVLGGPCCVQMKTRVLKELKSICRLKVRRV